MNILLIRHGDPDYVNDTLTKKGRQEAVALAKFLKNVPVKKFYCSPMGRARDTAAPTLSVLDRRAQILDWLHEFPDCVVDPKSGAEHVPWDFLPGEWTEIPEFYDKDKWSDTDIMKTGNAREVYDYICTSLDNFLASYGYVREGNCYRAVIPNHDTVVFICHFGSERPVDPQFICTLFDLDDGFLRYMAGLDNLVRLQFIAEKPQYLTVLGHLVTLLV